MTDYPRQGDDRHVHAGLPLESAGECRPEVGLHHPADHRRHLDDLGVHVAHEAFPVGGIELLVAHEDLDVRTQAREWRTELVPGVGRESPLRALRLVERCEHLVEAPR